MVINFFSECLCGVTFVAALLWMARTHNHMNNKSCECCSNGYQKLCARPGSLYRCNDAVMLFTVV